MLISVHHVTHYRYDAPARYAIQTLRLKPPSFDGQKVLSWSITTLDFDKALHFTDGYGNAAALVATRQEHSAIEIVARGLVETTDCAGVTSGLAEAAPRRIFLRDTPATVADEKIRDLAAAAEGTTELDKLHHLMSTIRDEVDYETGTTSAGTTAAEAFAQRRGVCQDYAHIFIAAARSLNVPARYVNGYFLSGADQPETAHHAWAEAYVEHLGWVGFDVANLICPNDRYVRLATGLDAKTANPVRGTRPLPSGCATGDERLDVKVEVYEQQQSSQQQ